MKSQNPSKLYPLIVTDKLEQTKRFYSEQAGFRVVHDRPMYLQVAYGEGDGPELAFMRPLGLFFWGRSWTLAAWCELRDDFRNFRTDRIRRLRIEERTFELVSPCTLEDYVRRMEKEP